MFYELFMFVAIPHTPSSVHFPPLQSPVACFLPKSLARCSPSFSLGLCYCPHCLVLSSFSSVLIVPAVFVGARFFVFKNAVSLRRDGQTERNGTERKERNGQLSHSNQRRTTKQRRREGEREKERRKQSKRREETDILKDA